MSKSKFKVGDLIRVVINEQTSLVGLVTKDDGHEVVYRILWCQSGSIMVPYGNIAYSSNYLMKCIEFIA